MIVSSHGFVFLHIPKCGGTSVRQAINPSDFRGKWWGREIDPDGLDLDLAHMTPETIRARRPEAFAEIDRLERYAVLRNPEDRLVSSFNEHLMRFHDTNLVRVGQTQLAECLAQIETIVATQEPLPAQVVHFTPQIRYVMLDGKRYVPNLYRLDDLERLRCDLNARHGTIIDGFDRSNKRKNTNNLRFRIPATEQLIWRVNELIWRRTPRPVYTAVKTAGVMLLTSQRGRNRSDLLRESPAFRRLMERTYAPDIDLWASVQ